MAKPFDARALERYPQAPGVYLMLNEAKEVIYVGKAKNLKNRLKSYFGAGGDDRPQIPYLIAQLHDIETIVVHSEKEALLLENSLIKRYQPRYNVLLKDDKGYISLKVNSKHPWPMLQLVRYKGAVPKDGTYFGPFTSAFQARQLFDLVGKIFPLRQCSDEEFARRKRPCILYQIKRCSAPCVDYVSKEDYQHYLDGAIRVIKGQNEEILETLHKEMDEASEALEFEKAKLIFDKIKLLEHAATKETLASKENGDAWALYSHLSDIVICKLLWRQGKLEGSHHFDFANNLQPRDELLASFLVQHYLAVGEIPREILLHEDLEDQTGLAELLTEKRGQKIEVKCPLKGDKKKLVDLAYTNAESFFKQRNDAKLLREETLLEMQEKLRLSRYPKRIDCIDNSHLSGSELVSASVAFLDGVRFTKEYRKYKIRFVDTPDDYAMMQEVLTRRYGKEKEGAQLPDLIIIDGGKGHLAQAAKVLKSLEIVSCDLIAIAKEASRHDKGITQERIFTLDSPEPIVLDKRSPLLFMLQNIRDEAHRFVLAFQASRRKKTTIKSALDEIPGIGPKKKKALIKAFGSIKAIAEKSVEELASISGISRRDAEAVVFFFKKFWGQAGQ